MINYEQIVCKKIYLFNVFRVNFENYQEINTVRTAVKGLSFEFLSILDSCTYTYIYINYMIWFSNSTAIICCIRNS